MSRFRAVIIEHGYKTSRYENEIISTAGGEFIDASDRPLGEALEIAASSEGIMVRRLEVTAEHIGRFRRCKIIARYGVGTDNVDVDAATAAGIIVGHCPLYASDEVSTHAVALLSACVRDVVDTCRRMRDGAWDIKRPLPVRRTMGRTLGIIGFGNIGKAVARKMAGWGLDIIAADPFVEKKLADELGVKLVTHDEVFRSSDYLSLNVPLLPETRRMINRASLLRMKEGVIIVNTARGAVVDTEALTEALDSGHVAMAGLDVFEEEPLPADSPLRRHPRVVLTDHMAWYSEESQLELQTTTAKEVARVCAGGLPVSLMNPEVLEKLGRRAEWNPPDNIIWQLKRIAKLKALPSPIVPQLLNS
jgi:D-3-phosphoglycerate dehydrogenase / 2-oxoglutarate reductase